jgi:hypothetical protein
MVGSKRLWGVMSPSKRERPVCHWFASLVCAVTAEAPRPDLAMVVGLRRSVLGRQSKAYCTAIVAVFDGTPPIEITTGTELPLVVPDGTNAFT